MQKDWETLQKQKQSNSISNREIVEKYHQFAAKGWPLVFLELYNIYRDGSYGQKKDPDLTNIFLGYAINVGTIETMNRENNNRDAYKKDIKKTNNQSLDKNDERSHTPTDLSESSDELRSSEESIDLNANPLYTNKLDLRHIKRK
ncbi:MAG: hypothetical protein Q8S21_06355 [Candidatus Paracaedibacteraceae bacterium]|nr:hypothetical protein [Candidatus Paracaedibacteraceae bacterium]